MLHYALGNDPKMFVSPLEARAPGVAYTVDTLQRLRSELPSEQCQLFLIVGADSLNTFSQWKDYTQVPELVDIIPVARPGMSDVINDPHLIAKLSRELGEGIAAEIVRNVVPYDGPALSSTAIRTKLKNGEPGLPIPSDVYRYSTARGLYL